MALQLEGLSFAIARSYPISGQFWTNHPLVSGEPQMAPVRSILQIEAIHPVLLWVSLGWFSA